MHSAVQPLALADSSVVPFSSPNPFFPSPALAPVATAALSHATIDPVATTATPVCPHESECDDLQDDSSLDSILLEDGPNPVKPATPGRPARTFFGVISAADAAESPVAAAPERASVPLGSSTVRASNEGPPKQAAPDQDSASDVRTPLAIFGFSSSFNLHLVFLSGRCCCTAHSWLHESFHGVVLHSFVFLASSEFAGLAKQAMPNQDSASAVRPPLAICGSL